VPRRAAADPRVDVFLAGILGSFEQDLLFLLVALILFGKRLPDVASTMGRKMYQFRRGIDEMKNEIARPLREQLEAPLREAAETARRAAEDTHRELRSTAEVAHSELNDAAERARSATAPAPADANVGNPTAEPVAAPVEPDRNPFPYPRAPRTPTP
jgi:Sec-independent protein translocase protein TatA